MGIQSVRRADMLFAGLNRKSTTPLAAQTESLCSEKRRGDARRRAPAFAKLLRGRQRDGYRKKCCIVHASAGVAAELRAAGSGVGETNISPRLISSHFHQRRSPCQICFRTRASGTKPS